MVQYKCRPLTPPAHQDRSKPQVESWPLPTARTAEDEFGPHAGARSLTHARARWNMVTLQPSGFVCSQSRASSSDLVTAPREVAGAGGPSRCRLQPVKRGAHLQMDEVRPRWALVLPLSPGAELPELEARCHERLYYARPTVLAATEDPQGTRVLNLFARDCITVQ